MVVAKLRVRSVAEPRFCHSWCLNSRQLMPQLSTGFNGYIQTLSKLKNWAWGAEVQSNSYKKESSVRDIYWCTAYTPHHQFHLLLDLPASSSISSLGEKIATRFPKSATLHQSFSFRVITTHSLLSTLSLARQVLLLLWLSRRHRSTSRHYCHLFQNGHYHSTL